MEDANTIRCECWLDDEGNLVVPSETCELHWSHVIDPSDPPHPELYP